MNWIPVTERLPDTPRNVLIVWVGKDDWPRIDVDIYSSGTWTEAHSWGCRVTHWMELPELPGDR